jgi:hypothetical protein
VRAWSGKVFNAEGLRHWPGLFGWPGLSVAAEKRAPLLWIKIWLGRKCFRSVLQETDRLKQQKTSFIINLNCIIIYIYEGEESSLDLRLILAEKLLPIPELRTFPLTFC